MAQLKERFPSGITYSIALDTTLAVTAGMEEIYKTLAEAMLLVILVVFVFLQGWRATLIPLCAVPVSLVSTFAVFPLLGFSVNTLSLLGLVLAIGLVVDDAIVVVEAVEHHIETGCRQKTPRSRQWKKSPALSSQSPSFSRPFLFRPLYSRDHWPTLPAVCGDYRGFRHFLRLQCFDFEPRACSPPAAAQERVPRAIGFFLQWI